MTALTAARSLPMWRALVVRDFRLLWASEAVSVVGDWFNYVALSFLVIDLTRSGLALGTVMIAAGVPRAIMTLPFGVMADRRSPRKLMIVAHLARGVIVGAMAALVLSGAATMPLLVVLSLLFGAADAIYLPAQQAFLPRTLESERLPSANALLQGTLQMASIAGPPIAGAAIAVVGTGAAFALDSASFFVAACIVMLISSSGVARPAREAAAVTGARTAEAAGAAHGTDAAEKAGAGSSFRRDIGAAVRYVLADSPLGTTLLLSLVLNFALNGPAAVGIPWLAQLRFHAGPVGLGLLSACWAAGALAGILIAANQRIERQGRVLVAAIAVSGVSMMAVGIAAWLPMAMVGLAAGGLMIGYVNVIAMSWLQARVASDMVGRVMSLAMLMGFGITPLSLGLSGALLDVNATALFIASGAIVVLVAASAALARYPARFDAPVPTPASALEPLPAAAGSQ
jgi:MFS family permease